MLVALYRTPCRAYHTIDHIDRCMVVLDTIEEPLVDKVAAELALFWHDAVYVIGAEPGRNEEQSSAILRALERSLVPQRLTLACLAIRDTAHHDPLPGDAFGVNGATTRAVVDVDLSILGAKGWEYARYVDQVQSEWGHLTEAEWSAGRGEFLRGMLGKERIFALKEMRDRLEGPARENMRAELHALEQAKG